MLTKTFKLVPLQSGTWKHVQDRIGQPYFEQVVFYDGEYPSAMMHIDFFHVPTKDNGKNDLYDRLNKGESVTVEVTFEEKKEE